MRADIRIVVLDLGGVLLHLRDPLATFQLELSPADFNRRWLLSESVRGLECGELDSSSFAIAAVEEFALPYGAREFLQRFETWPETLYPGVAELLEKLARHCKVALLSNTNPLHWNRADIAGVLEPRLHKLFLSYRTGHLKPDPVAFTDVIDSFGCDATEVLFFDDNPINIEAARRCGINAELTRGYDALLQNLQRSGVI